MSIMTASKIQTPTVMYIMTGSGERVVFVGSEFMLDVVVIAVVEFVMVAVVVVFSGLSCTV